VIKKQVANFSIQYINPVEAMALKREYV